MNSNSLPPMVCRVCQRALDMIITDDAVEFTHALADPDNHAAIAVPAPLGWRGACDFCTRGRPTHVLDVQDFAVPNMPTSMSVGNWAVCEDCTALISADNWSGLEARVILEFRTIYGHSMPGPVRAQLRSLYTSLRRSLTGGPRPIDDDGAPNGTP